MSKQYLTGPAGTGKTTQAVEHLKNLLSSGIAPYNILVLVPQRTLGGPYQAAFDESDRSILGSVDIITPDSLALRTINLLWPQIGEAAGCGYPDRPPVFLTIETAQYYMTQAIDPLLREGYFDPNVVSVTITLPRLMSQLLDNLEKAAIMGLPHTEVAKRLKNTLHTEISSRVAFDHAQEAVIAFHDFCLRNNLLDFGMRLEIFRDLIWANPNLRLLLTHRYRHLIVDNLEEHNPFTHGLLADWLPLVDSAKLIFDEDAGYRLFLGANAKSAASLQTHCDETITLHEAKIAPPEVLNLGHQIGQSLGAATLTEALQTEFSAVAETDPRQAFTFQQTRFHPQMLTWAIDQIERLVREEGMSPNEIVILAPFVSDALRFSFLNEMEYRGLPARSHRPSRALKEEPPAIALLTLARLLHPHWQMHPDSFDVMQALSLTIGDLDLVRARLLVNVLYRPYDRHGPFYPFEEVAGPVQERITYQIGHRFDELRLWLQMEVQRGHSPLDHTFSRLFGELLSQPGFGFHQSQEAGEVVANLIESIKKFRRVTTRVPLIVLDESGQFRDRLPDTDTLNRAYVQMIEQGVVAALYTRSWDPSPEEAVLIAPAYTYLMSNRPVDYQIWLDAGSNGWWERIAQPLTHPYVLSVDWPANQVWEDQHEVEAQIDCLYRLILGLTRRCRRHIFIANSEISEQGYEQRGRLLFALQQMLRRLE